MIQAISTEHTPESLAEHLRGEPGLVLLRSSYFDSPQARYSFVAARPFLTFRSFGSRCETQACRQSGPPFSQTQFGDPWQLLGALMSRYELLDEPDLPFPLGGCFGYWGYDLKNFTEPKLPRRAANDLGLPDCFLGFYDSLVVFDHCTNRAWIIATGLRSDGARNSRCMNAQVEFWKEAARGPGANTAEKLHAGPPFQRIDSSLSRPDFITRVEQAQARIRSGDIYQVNLSHRICVSWRSSGWDLFQRLASVSPAPFSAYLDCGDFQIASSSPELFLRMSGTHIQTRPIKGTRPRAADAIRDAQLSYELQTSPKEMAELVMITDLLRNDLGKVCEFGSVRVPELLRLERYPHVQHLVSTVEGTLRHRLTHAEALASCFPGGSITGAPKFRAMEIIDELEPVTRGPYTGALGYLGFNRESQLSIAIRTAVCTQGSAWFHTGAGIVADSIPAAEYEETLDKARGFFEALGLAPQPKTETTR